MSRATDEILSQAREQLAAATTETEVEAVRIEMLGRKGKVAALMSRIPRLPKDQRPAAGRAANELKQALAELVEEAAERVEAAAATDAVPPDPTLPPLMPRRGHIHPISRTFEEIVDAFRSLGFDVASGPEVELDHYAFKALNIPADHPARDEWDTYYITDTMLLRPHTSPGQVRVMEAGPPPVRIVVPGRCFRRDTEDARHFAMFHQVEGLMVDEGVSFSDLKAALQIFARQFFRTDVSVRFRPSFFPFTEPSADMDCTCVICGGTGCRTCSYSGWIEVLGAGMVHPEVLRGVGYDAERYTGFAFGMGVERLAMLKYQIADGRNLYQGDVRFLSQF